MPIFMADFLSDLEKFDVLGYDSIQVCIIAAHYTIQPCISQEENMPKTKSREQLLGTAADLFYREGFRAVGVDTISAVSGVGKMTLYRQFQSKDELIVAYLNESNVRFWEWFERVTALAPTPREKILAFFDALAEQATKPSCHGCPFLNVTVDFPDLSYPGHGVAIEHKKAVRNRFRDLAAEAGCVEPEQVADGLFLLMDGAYMAIRLYGTGGPALGVRKAAESLLTNGATL
jgi:AcrR family transcriptional regulator